MFISRLTFVLVQTVILEINSFPLTKNVNRKPLIPTNRQISFLQNFGYLDGGQTGYEAQYSEDTVVEAIINMQRFGGIEQTGYFDKETIELLNKRRCGVKDVIKDNKRRRRYVTVGRGWRKRRITYRIINWNSILGEDIIKSEIKRALDVWAKYGNLTFIPVNDSPADIKVSFYSGEHGDRFPFDGSGNILAHAFFPYIPGGGNIHFDDDEIWSLENSEIEDATAFFPVAVHELGHSLGIGHSDIPESIMFPYYTEEVPERLDKDDVMAMYELYLKYPMPNEGIENSTNNTTEVTLQTETTTASINEVHDDEVTDALHGELDSSTVPTKLYTRNNLETTHHGDFETVDDHKKYESKFGMQNTSFNKHEELCNGFDTIAVLREELFVFKGKNVWRYKKRGKLEDGYPVALKTMFPFLPTTIDRIDAVYERKNGSITLFSGSNYWIYDDNVYGPIPLDRYELPKNMTKVNAVLLWPKNDKTYLYKGDKFWRFDEETNLLDKGYPKSMIRWRGIPNDIDAAIHWVDGSTYFFKGLSYWRFNNELIQAVKNYPLPVPEVWFGCPENPETYQELPQ